MSGETEQAVSGWTVDTLHSHLVNLYNERDRRYEERFNAQEKAVGAALAAAEKAVGKAEVAAEKRFDSVNEFRGQLADQARDFMPRKEAELQIAALAERLNAVEGHDDRGSGRLQGTNQTWAAFSVAILVFVAVVGLIITIVTR